ncbi:MAG TPA: hypothetical protein VHY08_09885 [Bacillota bacterium]|nr:hypothetical protein [Bacillota bacterium]
MKTKKAGIWVVGILVVILLFGSFVSAAMTASPGEEKIGATKTVPPNSVVPTGWIVVDQTTTDNKNVKVYHWLIKYIGVNVKYNAKERVLADTPLPVGWAATSIISKKTDAGNTLYWEIRYLAGPKLRPGTKTSMLANTPAPIRWIVTKITTRNSSIGRNFYWEIKYVGPSPRVGARERVPANTPLPSGWVISNSFTRREGLMDSFYWDIKYLGTKAKYGAKDRVVANTALPTGWVAVKPIIKSGKTVYWDVKFIGGTVKKGTKEQIIANTVMPPGWETINLETRIRSFVTTYYWNIVYNPKPVKPLPMN